jgi:DNA repair protein RadC
VRDVAAHDRPREKLARCGTGSLGDNELLAILIGHGTGSSSALSSANAVLSLADGVQGLPKLHRAHFEQVPGIGPAQASRIIAAVELGRRTLTTPARDRPRFLKPADIAAYLLPRFGAHPVERFGALLLDARYRLLAVRLLSVGSIDASLAEPRELLREALLAAAPVAVAFHNHPSGDPSPSPDDVALTRRLKTAGNVVGVALLDHVILADARYCSLREMNLV